MSELDNIGFSLERKTPYTKPITIQQFIVNEYEYSDLNLQNDLHTVLKEHENKSFPLHRDIKLKCRKFLVKNGKLFAFISFYDGKIDVSITNDDSNDEISAESINNADTCHLFLMVKDNSLFAFSTISSLHLLSKVTNALSALLDNTNLHLSYAIDKDIINVIKTERVSEIGIETNVDLLALGFNKKNFVSRLFGDTQKTDSNISYGKIIFDKKNNPAIIEKVEHSPQLALEYIHDDEADTNSNIYIKTKKNRRIDSDKLKKQRTYYVNPYLKTKTVIWGDAISVLDDISI